MNKIEYNNKINAILNDKNKFTEIKKDPTNTLKVKLNKIITKINTHNKNRQNDNTTSNNNTQNDASLNTPFNIHTLKGKFKPG